MTERPILFNGWSVRATLEGRKTQTRRVVKYEYGKSRDYDNEIKCPYGVPGDRLWVRETFAFEDRLDHLSPSEIGEASTVPIWYKATPMTALRVERGKWRPSIFMPHWASRLTLKVTDVRVERVQDISEEDAIAEGLQHYFGGWGSGDVSYKRPVGAFAKLWDSINEKRGLGWDKNPWVWVIAFQYIT